MKKAVSRILLLLIALTLALLAASCSVQKSTTCATKSVKPKESSKLTLVEPIDSIERHIIRIQYVVLDYVAPHDTVALESYLVASHNNLNAMYNKGFIFETNSTIWYDYHDVNIDDTRGEGFDKTLDAIGREDGTVYVYVVGNTRTTLLGYTYVFPSCKECYVSLAPKYDFIILARESVSDTNTLAHEVGHFFGLPHTFEIKPKDLHLYGLEDAKEYCHNTMGYVCCASDRTDKQVGIMWNYGALHRHNLIQNNFY